MVGDRAILVGGPRDGQEFPLKNPRPEEIRTVEPVESSRFAAEMLDMGTTFRVVVYRLARVAGWPSRDDQGRLRYLASE